jgi:hypothetical protein
MFCLKKRGLMRNFIIGYSIVVAYALIAYLYRAQISVFNRTFEKEMSECEIEL